MSTEYIQSEVNDVTNMLDKFKMLDLTNKASIKNKKCRNVVKEFIKVAFNDKIFNEHIEECVDAVIMSYSISSSNMFKGDYSNIARMLLDRSNLFVMTVETSVKNRNLSSSLINVFQNYFSVYRIWVSEDVLVDIDNMLDKLVDMCIGHKVAGSLDTEIVTTINSMFNIDTVFSTKTLLRNYEKICSVECAEKCLWTAVHNWWDSLYRTVVEELVSKVALSNNDKIIVNKLIVNSKLDDIVHLISSKMNIDSTDIFTTVRCIFNTFL